MFSGTVVLDRTVSSDARTASGYNWAQPFGGMADFGSYDAAVADLECPVTNDPVPSPQQINVDNPKFNCLPGWLPELKKYFPVINLSSNHAYDRGADGFAQTVTTLKQAGFQVVGNYDPHTNKDNCTIVTLPVRLQKTGGGEGSGDIPIAVCSFNYKSLFSPEPGELDYIKRYQSILPVFGMLNAGTEYQPQAGQTQVTLAHQMIDLGADFVIGNGTHWVQNSEAYKGKLITYSLGNFIFDQADDESRRAANIVIQMSADYDNNMAEWLKVGRQCQASPSRCLNLIQASNAKRESLHYKFSVVASEGGYHTVTHIANAAQLQGVEGRLNWANTLKGLQQN